MIIFLRGLPGTGKTTLADKLGERLGWKVIHADSFKSVFMRQHPGADFFKEVLPDSFRKILAELSTLKGQNAIVEELFRDPQFVQDVLLLCEENKIEYCWFRLKRDMKTLSEVEDSRITRKIKNSPEILKRMEKELDSLSIAGEVVINNNDIGNTLNQIIKSL